MVTVLVESATVTDLEKD